MFWSIILHIGRTGGSWTLKTIFSEFISLSLRRTFETLEQFPCHHPPLDDAGIAGPGWEDEKIEPGWLGEEKAD